MAPINCGVADEFRTNAASGARSRFHSETFHTHSLEAIVSPHSQHGGGGAVLLFVQVHDPTSDALVEHTCSDEQVSLSNDCKMIGRIKRHIQRRMY